MNGLLLTLAILGVLFILSGHTETFLNREGFVNIGDISPGVYPGPDGLLDKDYPRLRKRGCRISKNGSCSRCSFEKKVKLGDFSQITNNDMYKHAGSPNDGTTFPSDMTYYGARKTPAQPAPFDIGQGLRVNKFHSIC
jgi:hypothetical protein